jgi:hypothetical protein
MSSCCAFGYVKNSVLPTNLLHTFTLRNQHYMHDLTSSVAAIDNEIGPGGVRAGIRSEVDVGALELSSLGITAQGDHAVPQILSLLVNKVRQTSVDVARRDGVDTCEVAPFVGERAGKVDATSLRDVVGSLIMSVKSSSQLWMDISPVLGGSWQCDRTWRQ